MVRYGIQQGVEISNDNSAFDRDANWDSRGKKFTSDQRAVLFQSLPPVINEYLHRWHLSQLDWALQALGGKASKVLDVGCGYGRLSKPIIESYDNITVTGVDVSSEFVRLFNENPGDRERAVQASVTDLPFADGSFDFIFSVTTLMYVHEELDKALSEIWRVLRPGGKCLLIENNRAGVGVYSLGGLINKLRRRPSLDYSFAFGEIDRAVAGLGGSIIRRHGCTALTFCLLPSYLLSKLSEGLTRRLLDLTFRLDNRLRNRIRLSLYISYFIEKEAVE